MRYSRPIRILRGTRMRLDSRAPSLRALLMAPAVAGVLTLGVGSVAVAAELPENEELYTIACQTQDGQLYSIAPVDATLTPIGTPTVPPPFCGYDSEQDPVSGHGYVVASAGFTMTLSQVDLATGAVVEVAPITASGSPMSSVQGFAIDNAGVGYFTYGDELFRLDLDTAEATPVADFGNGLTTWGMSRDPRTGSLYAIATNGGVYRMDPSAPSTTLVGTFPYGPDTVETWGIAIDSEGTAWIATREAVTGPYVAVWAVPLDELDTATPEFIGYLSPNNDVFYTWGIMIGASAAVPTPQLAATGSDAGVALGAAVLAMFAASAGWLLVARSRRRATR